MGKQVYYKLNENFAFRGWKQLPYALCALRGERALLRPVFFDKDSFMTLLSCNGEEAVDTAGLAVPQARLLAKLTQEGLLHSSEMPMGALNAEQRYVVYPSIYLELVHWSVTGKCNYQCRHCLLSAPSGCHPQLPLKDCLHIVAQIGACGIRQVDITGGEPLVRADFLEIVRALSEQGVHIRMIFTNGSLLTEELLDALARMGQRPAFQISYDGVGHHDWLRGVSGAEKQALAAIELLNKRGLSYRCAMCLHKENADSLADTVRLLAKYGCSRLRLNTPQELGAWRGYSEQYALSWQEAWEVYKAYIPVYFQEGMPIAIDMDGFFSCQAHSTCYSIGYIHDAHGSADLTKTPFCETMKYHAHIDAEGRLLPCMAFADMPMSNRFPSLLYNDLGKATWDSFYSEVARTSVQQMMDHNSACRDCEHILCCRGGCMVAGAISDGDYFHYDPHCCWFHKHVGEAAVREVADTAIRRYASEIKQRENAESSE